MATTTEFGGGFKAITRMRMKMGANFKALKGTIACIARAGGNQGFVVAGASAADLVSIGRFGETVDNTGGAAGAKSVEILFHRSFECLRMVNDTVAAVAQTEVGGTIYIKDNNTVSADGTGRSEAGVCWGFEDGLVLYEPAQPRLAA